MDQICRLCLTVSENMTCKLGEEMNVMDKLFCLNIQILINDLLPNLVCHICFKTLDNIINYRENIIKNQHKLIEQLNKGKLLNNFYQSLKYKHNVKTEMDLDIDSMDKTVHHESKPIKNIIRGEGKIFNELSKDDDETVNWKSVIPVEGKRKKKIHDKKALIYKKANSTYKKLKIRKELESKTKTKRKQPKLKPTEIDIDSKSVKELCIKVEENTSEETSTNKHMNCDTDNTILDCYKTKSKKEENTIFIDNNEIDVKIKNNKCLTCFQCFSSNSELIKHYRTIHNIEDKENCHNDLAQDNSRSNECKEILSEKTERPYNCKVCGRTFISVYTIVRHARTHSDYNLSCSYGCGYSTVYRGALSDHEKRHEKNYRYKCSTCGAGFHVKTWHDQHQNIHNNIKPYICDVCGMAFHMDRYLTSHRTTAHPSELSKGVKRFLCPHCDQAFETTRNFRTHLEEHRGKKKFLCALCGKECATGEQLKRHNNSHLGIKPFACSICNKKFAKKFNLSVHQRAHAGEKHLCQECGKHFAQRSTLLRHARKCHPESKEYNKKSKLFSNK